MVARVHARAEVAPGAGARRQRVQPVQAAGERQEHEQGLRGTEAVGLATVHILPTCSGRQQLTNLD